MLAWARHRVLLKTMETLITTAEAPERQQQLLQRVSACFDMSIQEKWRSRKSSVYQSLRVLMRTRAGRCMVLNLSLTATAGVQMKPGGWGAAGQPTHTPRPVVSDSSRWWFGPAAASLDPPRPYRYGEGCWCNHTYRGTILSKLTE